MTNHRGNLSGTKQKVSIEMSRSLASRVIAGEEDAFTEIVRSTWKQVTRIAGRFFKNPEDIKEISQEVYLKAYTRILQYRGEKPLSHWLTSITVNVCYDRLRKMKHHLKEISLTETWYKSNKLSRIVKASQKITTSNEQIEKEITAQQILSLLNPSERIVLTLQILEDKRISEISEITGWSKANIKVRAYRARKKLRKILKITPYNNREK